jgi:hypothetical protein
MIRLRLLRSDAWHQFRRDFAHIKMRALLNDYHPESFDSRDQVRKKRIAMLKTHAPRRPFLLSARVLHRLEHRGGRAVTGNVNQELIAGLNGFSKQ